MTKGRAPKYTQEEIDQMRDLFTRYSAPEVGRLMRCSPTTVLRAVDGKLVPKEKSDET